MYLSTILLNVLNNGLITSCDVSRLIDRWEIAEATIGDNRGWHPMSNLSYIERQNAWCHNDDACGCDHCSEYVLLDNLSDVYTFNSRGNRISYDWCESCRDSDSFYCGGCSETFSDRDARETEDGNILCTSCHEITGGSEEDDDDQDEPNLPSYHNARRPYSPYDLQTERVYSVELEVESKQRGALLNHLEANPIERTVWEGDGSLNCEEGVEFLVCFQNDTEKLKSVLSQLVDVAKKHQSTSWANTRCGCHVNSNKARSLWTSSRVMKLLWLVRQFKTTLQAISGRDTNHYASWNNLPSLRSWSLGYCEKYTCVRIGCDRIEWRMFRGTLNKARLGLYVDVVKCLEDFALAYGIHELRKKHLEIAGCLEALTETARSNGARI